MSGNATLQPCPCYPPSTVFIYDTPTFQNAADTVYVNAQAYNSTMSSQGKMTKYQFKTDFERMQNLIGLYGRTSQGLR
jgi:hypothetical protein